jgi:hypothetical protein
MSPFRFLAVLGVSAFFVATAQATFYCPDNYTPVDGCPDNLEHCMDGSSYTKWESSGNGYTKGDTITCHRDDDSMSSRRGRRYKEQDASPSDNGAGAQ